MSKWFNGCVYKSCNLAFWLLQSLCGFFILCAAVYAQSSAPNGLQLPSSIQPGQLVVAQAPPNSMVKVGDKPVQVNDQGIFVFGVGRDATASVKIQLQQGKQTITQLVPIDSRQYKTDKITGVEKKYVSPPEDVLTRIRQDNQQIGAARATNSDRTDFLAPIVWPATGRISGVYGSQRVFNGVPKRPHFGLDIANKTGSTVVAPWSGKVVLAVDDMYYSGGTLIIDHGFGVTSTYIHLSKITVEVGQEIKQGEKIAEIGATGRVTGPHLDWRINWFNERLDPALLFDLNGVAMNSQVKAKQKTLIKN